MITSLRLGKVAATALLRRLTLCFINNHKSTRDRYCGFASARCIARKMMTLHPAVLSYTDNVIKPDCDTRLYRSLTLKNEMKVLIICDPETDKAAAALDVNVGNLSNPGELPGLAHFCEHMLFLGTEKYPGENTYSDFITTHGGSSNAYTSLESTNYHFEVAPDHFKQALDIFAQFFLKPLFTESATERELNAVDSEHMNNIQNDRWRLMQLEHSLSKEGHDYSKFGTGNKTSLEVVPKSKGINVREALLQFHDKYYSANLMGLSVLSKEGLDDMTNIVAGLFGNIENTRVLKPSWPEHPYSDQQLCKKVFTVPIKDIRKLSLVWPCPDLHKWWECLPDHYIAHLMGHEGKGSLLSALKAHGWVNGLVAGGKPGATGFSFLMVDVDLTEEGIEHVDDIITLVYQYIDLMKKDGPHEWIFEEGRDLNRMNFRFKDKERPISFVTYMASSLHYYPPEEVGSGAFLWKNYEPEVITEVINLLTPEKMLAVVVGRKYSGTTTAKEEWYGTEYRVEEIEPTLVEKWSQPGTSNELHLPERNEFIPKNFDLRPRDADATEYPRIIKDMELSRCWFKQDDEYKLPKGCVTVAIRSPQVSSSPLNANLTWLFLRLFSDTFAEYSYNAELTKLKYDLSTAHYGFLLTVSGYTDKLPVLLKTLMDTLTTFKADPKRVEIFVEEYTRGLKNFLMAQPTQHAEYHIGLLLKEGGWTMEELLECVDEMTVDNLEYFIPSLLSRIYLEYLVYGNFTCSEALALTELVEQPLITNLRSRALHMSQHSRIRREVQLPDDSSFAFRALNECQPSSCVHNYYQLGMEDTHSCMLLELLLQIIRDPVFNVLRTQEQLGYVVYAWMRRASGVQGMQVVVQSGKHPEFVDLRIEAFLATVKGILEKLTEEEYQAHVSGLVTARLTKPKNMRSRHSHYWNEIVTENYMFNRDVIETEHVKTITKEQLIEFFTEMLAVEAKKRHKLSVQIISKEHDQSATDHLDGLRDPAQKPVTKIESHIDFKRGLQLFSLPKPRIELPKSTKSKL